VNYFILTYLLNIDMDIDIAVFRLCRIDIVSKSKNKISKHQ